MEPRRQIFWEQSISNASLRLIGAHAEDLVGIGMGCLAGDVWREFFPCLCCDGSVESEVEAFLRVFFRVFHQR